MLGLLAGCKSVPHAGDRGCTSDRVAARSGFSVGPEVCGTQVVFPNGTSLEDGLTEEEAVLIALWNNALFQQRLADLGVARGDLVQAGLLPNPDFLYTFPVPDKFFRYAFELPVEALWLRPIRVAAAAREADRVSEQLTQAGLDLIRDVRQTYADVLLAKGQFTVAEEAVRIRGQISELAEARLKAGDISPQEAATARVDALQAQQELKRARYDISLAEERLKNLLAIGMDRRPLALDARIPPPMPVLDADVLATEAASTRPDALAAAQSVAAAAERLRLSRLSWVRVTGIGDATAGQRTGHELGPGFRVTVPIFDRNQGNIARAEAELERAQRQQTTVRNQIILDVHQAHFLYEQAQAELDILDGQVLPKAREAIQRSERAYREGATPYVVVLEATRQILVSLSRREQLQANLRRARAELERSVGRRLELAPPCAILGTPTA
jgi:cobalt-zinc-cadmium efflux system outer membrane protein